MSILLALLLAAPDWVAAGGSSPRFPPKAWLTGFAHARGPDALASAKAAAAADLASRIVVRIESQTLDVQEQKGDQYKQEIAAVTRASTDVRLTGLRTEAHQDGDRAWALAVVERAAAAAERRKLRDESAAQAQKLLDQGAAAEKEKREADALRAFLAVRVAVAEASSHEAVARAIEASPEAAKFAAAMVDASRRAEDRVTALLRKPVSTLKDAVESLALQLERQGVAAGARWTVAPLSYAATSYSSVFGRSVAQDVERALAQLSGAGAGRQLALRGSYLESGGDVKIKLVASEVSSGRLVAGAEAAVPKSAIPGELPFVPQNLMQALQDQKILGAEEAVAGGLRVDLTTSLGNRDLLLSEKQEYKLLVRANKPCWVRLVYILANGMRVPIEQAWYLDESKRNLFVEYPNAFEVSPPFGVERFQAVAFTEKPAPLAIRKVTVGGQPYEVVADDAPAALVAHRGVKLAKAKAETAESVITMTTTPK